MALIGTGSYLAIRACFKVFPPLYEKRLWGLIELQIDSKVKLKKDLLRRSLHQISKFNRFVGDYFEFILFFVIVKQKLIVNNSIAGSLGFFMVSP